MAEPSISPLSASPLSAMRSQAARLLQSSVRPLLALLISMLLGAVLIAIVQRSITAPFAAYGALAKGAFGDSNSWSNTLQRTMPLLLTGLAVSVALAAGLFNIGAEGQVAVGGLLAAWVGFAVPLPAPLLLPLALIIGMAAGAVWAYLPALLKVKRGAHEVITAILLNYIAQNTTRYLATVPLKDPSGQVPQTPLIRATLPPLAPGYDVHAGLLIAVISVFVVWVLLNRTVWGYEVRAVGEGAGAAEAAGIRVGQIQFGAMLVSGALAGLAGAVVVLGDAPFRRFPADFYGAGYGFDGLAVALLAGNPIFVLPSALLFGALNSGAEAMTFAVGTPKQIASIVQAILIVGIALRLPRLHKRKKGNA